MRYKLSLIGVPDHVEIGPLVQDIITWTLGQPGVRRTAYNMWETTNPEIATMMVMCWPELTLTHAK